MALVWLALAVSSAAVLTAAVMTTRRALALFRDAKRVGAGISTELEAIERATVEIEGHLAAASTSADALRRRSSGSRSREPGSTCCSPRSPTSARRSRS